jgi:hypothetical protein
MSHDLATLTAILYAARWQRRVPESDTEKRHTIAYALIDAKLIVAAVIDDRAAHVPEPPPEVSDECATVPSLTVATPEQPPPSPGTIGRIADAKATRRRG